MKTWEFKRKAQKFLRIIRNYSLKSSRTILGFIRRHPMALFALFISIIGSAPITSRFLIYYLYEPKIGVHLGSYEDDLAGKTTFNFSDIWGVNIDNMDVDRDIQIYIEFVTSESVILRPHPGEPLEKDWKKGLFIFRTESFEFDAYSGLYLHYPFEPHDKEYTLVVILHSEMEMSEFGLPPFFGDIVLRPIRKTFTIEP